MIRAILFDLDGTLLPMDFDAFVPRYFGLLLQRCGTAFAGLDLLGLIRASTEVMIQNDGSRTNEDRFFDDFVPRVARSRDEVLPIFLDFYRRDFPSLGAAIVPDPTAAAVVETCRGRDGLKLVLATNPIFPRVAIDARARWAGIDTSRFDLVTSAEVMRWCKPHPGYYKQIATEIGVAPGECLMVGNDTELDLAPAVAAGMKTCLVNNEYQRAADGFVPDHACALAGVPALLESASVR